jgi:hypothetical protein
MDRFTGGCLWQRPNCSVGPHTGSAFVIVSTAASIAGPFPCFRGVPQDTVTIDGETRDYAGRFSVPAAARPFRTQRGRVVNLGSWMPDQLMPTYENWIIRRESGCRRFRSRRYDAIATPPVLE